MSPETLRYTATHEWAGWQDGLVVVGITKFAVEQLTDIVYIDLPTPGRRVTAGEPFGEIESVKAVSDLYAPISGEVVDVNRSLVDDPTRISADPYGAGWMIKIRPDPGETLDRLLTLEQYQRQIAQAG
ncbi:MAG: glycine cleavage system protein H [Gemmataceae bacterium]|mgnify:CR=1 FL=1